MDSSEQLDRIDALEREVRRLRRFVPMLAVAFAVLLLWKFVPGPATIEARRFLVRDAHGAPRAEMGMWRDDRPMVRLNDRYGKARAMFYLFPERGGNLRFTDTTGYNRLQMMLREDGKPEILVANEGGRTRTQIGLSAEGRPAIVLCDADLQWEWWAPPPQP